MKGTTNKQHSNFFMSAQITAEVMIRTGTSPEGQPEFAIVGQLTEENFGRGNVKRRVKLHTSILNPVLFQQAKAHIRPGSSFVYLEHRDLARRFRDQGQPPDEAPPTDRAPTHGIHVPEYGQLVAENVGGEWLLSMIHKGSKDVLYETLPWPATWPAQDAVTAQFLFEEGFKIPA